VVNDKVESGQLNQDTMKNEAQGMYQNMGNNPLFQAMNQMGQNTHQSSNPRQSNKTRERLQRKLKEKQKAKITKLDE
jgi:hypothetical protein